MLFLTSFCLPLKNETSNTIMKTMIPLLAMIFLAGCGNNSTNQSSSTNNDNTVNNSPPVQVTNTPAITNDAGTNLPATTNQ
jgi:uncharacterized lipoprotein YajG